MLGCYYCPPRKLQEDNVCSLVCMSLQWEVSLYRALALAASLHSHPLQVSGLSHLYRVLLPVQGSSPLPVQCPDSAALPDCRMRMVGIRLECLLVLIHADCYCYCFCYDHLGHTILCILCFNF